MFTMIAPTREVAYWVMIHSKRLGDHSATRSPFFTPRAIRPRAMRPISAHICL